ncbi:TPA: hypothetical protein AB5A43_000880 [Vibrio cholerae]
MNIALKLLILAMVFPTHLSFAQDEFPSKDPNAHKQPPVSQATPLEDPDAPLPTVLYRMDSRPPYIDETTAGGRWVGTEYIGRGVFQVGLTPLGDNSNLAEHVAGTSTFIKNADTAFVAFSRNLHFPWKWGMSHVANDAHDKRNKKGMPYVYTPDYFYIYAVRPADHIYNMSDTYQFNLKHLKKLNKEIMTESQMRGQLHAYRHQEEWVGFGAVDVSHIRSVEVWRLHREGEFAGQFRLESRIANPNYIEAQTFPSRTPLLIQPEETQLSFLDQVRRVFSTPDGQTYPIAFLSCMTFLHNFRHRDPREIEEYDAIDICPELKYAYVPKSIQIVRNPQNMKNQMVMEVPWNSVNRATNYYNQEHYPDNCTVETQDYHLYVRCNATPPYPTSYLLHLGAGGPANTWIDQSCIFSFSEQEENGQFVVNIRDLHVVGSQYALALYDYTIKQAFSGTGGWWSNITITPIYPVLPDEEPSNCIWSINAGGEL